MSVELVKYVNDNDVDNIPKINHYNVDNVKRILIDVKLFIMEKKHIVFGGLAIDAALKLNGSGIYSEYDIPDYDTMSTNNVNDAYELANKLFTMGYGENSTISVIKAIHTTTMRIRVDQDYVADFGYCPPEIFKKIPTITYDGLIFSSPVYQRADMYSSLSNPMQGKPFYNIYNRSRKDVKRLILLDKYCPVISNPVKYKTRKVKYIPNTAIIFGFGAYAMMYDKLSKLSIEAKIPMPNINKLNIIYHTNGEVEIEIPEDYAITVYDDVTTHTNYRFLDLFPESNRTADIERYNRFGKLLTYTDLNNMYIASPPHTITYFLMMHMFSKNAELFLNFYIDYKTLIEFGLMHFKDEKCLHLIDEMWGTLECNNALSFKMVDFSKKIGIPTPDYIPKHIIDHMTNLPKNVHLKTTTKFVEQYTYGDECTVFKMSGEEIPYQ
jgi:hypothetical protein